MHSFVSSGCSAELIIFDELGVVLMREEPLFVKCEYKKFLNSFHSLILLELHPVEAEAVVPEEEGQPNFRHVIIDNILIVI